MLAKEEIGEDHARIVPLEDRCERHTNSDEGMVGDHAKDTQMTKEGDLRNQAELGDCGHSGSINFPKKNISCDTTKHTFLCPK